MQPIHILPLKQELHSFSDKKSVLSSNFIFCSTPFPCPVLSVQQAVSLHPPFQPRKYTLPRRHTAATSRQLFVTKGSALHRAVRVGEEGEKTAEI
jgi:hypothetical protein